MTITNELKKAASDTGYAVVGVTDLAVERLKDAQARAARVRAELDSSKVQDRVQQVPTQAVAKGLEAASKIEGVYDDLSERGKQLVERISNQRTTQELVNQGRAAASRTKAAATTLRRGAKRTSEAAQDTAEAVRDEAGTAVKESAAEAGSKATSTARKQTPRTRSNARRTTSTARSSASSAKTATKAATTSSRKAAAAATDAAKDTASTIGD